MARVTARSMSCARGPVLRLVTLLFGLTSGPASAAAASSADAAGTTPVKQKIVVWHTQERLQARFLREMLTTFAMQTPGLTVELEDIVDLSAVLLKGATLGALPDVVLAPADFVGMHAPLRLSTVGRTQQNSQVAPEHYAAVTIDGAAYGEPVLSGNHLVLYYDNALLPAAPSSWEELTRWKAEGRIGAPRARRGAPGGWPFGDPYFFLPFLLASGGLDLATARIDVTRANDALVAYEALSKGGLVQADCPYACATEDFFAGRFAFVINGEWAFEETRAALGTRFGMAPLPTLGGKRMTSPRGVFALLFPNEGLSSGKGPTLRALARWLQSEEVQRSYVREARRFPVHARVSAELPTLGDAQFAALGRILRESAPVTPSPEMLFVWPALRKGINLYLTAGATPSQAARLLEGTARAAAMAFERFARPPLSPVAAPVQEPSKEPVQEPSKEPEAPNVAPQGGRQ
jgi:maltose-binding protein MalE